MAASKARFAGVKIVYLGDSNPYARSLARARAFAALGAEVVEVSHAPPGDPATGTPRRSLSQRVLDRLAGPHDWARAGRRLIQAVSAVGPDIIWVDKAMAVRPKDLARAKALAPRAPLVWFYGGEVAVARMGGLADPAAFRPRAMDGRLHMLSVSRLEANKRIDWILDALAALSVSGLFETAGAPDWRFDVVGAGSLGPTLQSQAAALGLADRVVFHGFVDDARLQGLYDSAHLFLMPARQGYGIPAVEALGRGLPVLLHRDSGVSDILMDTPWCVVMHGGPEALVAALAQAIRSAAAGAHLQAPPPAVPTEAQWAERVASLCGWL